LHMLRRTGTALAPVPLNLLASFCLMRLSLLFPPSFALSRHSETGTMIHLHSPSVSLLHQSKSIMTATTSHSRPAVSLPFLSLRSLLSRVLA
jgi:hypothetical protein